MTRPLTFEERLKLVAAEIERRKQEAKPANKQAFVAALWVRWIKQNVLDDG